MYKFDFSQHSNVFIFFFLNHEIMIMNQTKVLIKHVLMIKGEFMNKNRCRD